MGVGYRQANLLEAPQEARTFGDRGAATAQQLGQRLPVHQLPREKRLPGVETTDVVNGYGPRVLELASDLGLLDEAVNEIGIIAMGLKQDLAGQFPTQLRIADLSTAPMALCPISPNSSYRPDRSPSRGGGGAVCSSGCQSSLDDPGSDEGTDESLKFDPGASSGDAAPSELVTSWPANS